MIDTRRHRHQERSSARTPSSRVSLAVANAAAEASGHAALPLRRRARTPRTLPVPVHERHQRRRPRRQQARLPGVHDRSPRLRRRFAEALRAGTEIFHAPEGASCKKKGYSTAVGDEGGFAPNLKSNEEALETIVDAIEPAGYKPGTQIGDRPRPCREPELYDEQEVRLQEVGRRDEVVRPDDRDVREVGEGVPASSPSRTASARRTGTGWRTLTKALGGKVQLVGDDIFVTEPEDPRRGHRTKGIANSILIKVNQIGSLTETLECMALAPRAPATPA